MVIDRGSAAVKTKSEDNTKGNKHKIQVFACKSVASLTSKQPIGIGGRKDKRLKQNQLAY
jgi:hypothetical protein